MLAIKDNKIKNLTIFLLTIFILLFFTKSAFYNMNELLDINNKNTQKVKNIVTQLNSLQKLEQDLKSWKKDKSIKYFMVSPNRSDLIQYFYDYSEDISNAWNSLFISNITFSKPSKSELGFMKENINLVVTISNKNVLNAFLTKLTSDRSEYRFFIPSFSFPNDNRNSWYTVTIPLILLYK